VATVTDALSRCVPPGRRFSSSTVNVVWGFFNIVVGYALVCRVGDFHMKHMADAAALGAGAFPLALVRGWRFGRFNCGSRSEQP